MNNQRLTIVAKILAKEEQRELVKNELTKLVEPTRAEDGCINYDLHQDNKNPNLFIFYENWTSPEALQKHLKSDHITAYSKATKEAVAEFVLHEMTHIA